MILFAILEPQLGGIFQHDAKKAPSRALEAASDFNQYFLKNSADTGYYFPQQLNSLAIAGKQYTLM